MHEALPLVNTSISTSSDPSVSQSLLSFPPQPSLSATTLGMDHLIDPILLALRASHQDAIS